MLHCTALDTALNCAALHCTGHCIELCCTAPHWTLLHLTSYLERDTAAASGLSEHCQPAGVPTELTDVVPHLSRSLTTGVENVLSPHPVQGQGLVPQAGVTRHLEERKREVRWIL